MSQLFPEVRDLTTLEAVFSRDQFLGIGVEGQMASSGATASVATEYVITRPADADALFGSSSSLSALVKFLLNRGCSVVRAVPSATSSPNLTQRKAAWALLEEDRDVRIRLTDSTTIADLAALADSAEWAEKIQHKQVAFVGQATVDKATAIANAGTINSKRAVYVTPGVYDVDGTLLTGQYAAAWVASMVALNPDITDDLDLVTLPGTTGVERDTNGRPYYRVKSNAGTPINDFEEILQAGGSPLMQGTRGGAAITHLRMAWVGDATMDALLTRLVVDQVFIDVRDWAEDTLKLRKPNTEEDRLDVASGVTALLTERRDWIRPKVQPDGTLGYGVSVSVGNNGHGIIIHYFGSVVRNTQTIDVQASLTIDS